ncbi:hypothetical protein CerSpe_271630 [Prunus speciosa]
MRYEPPFELYFQIENASPFVRPLNNEHDLQRLDEIQLDKLRPEEFRSGLDTLTRIVKGMHIWRQSCNVQILQCT